MSSSVSISTWLNQTISTNDWKGSGIKGFLVGHHDDPSTFIAVWENNILKIEKIREAVDDCLSCFPCGKRVTGIIQIASLELSKSLLSGDKLPVEREIVQTFGSVEHLLELFDTDLVNALYLYKSNKDPSKQDWEKTCVSISKSSITIKKIDVCLSRNIDVGMRMRLKAEVPLVMSYSSNNSEERDNQLEEECTKLQNSLFSDMFVFGFDGNRALMRKQGVKLISAESKSWRLVRDIKKYMKEVAEEREETLSGSFGKGIQSPVDISLLRLGSPTDSCPTHAPIIVHRKGLFSSVQLKLPIDVLMEVKEDLSVQKLYSLLVQSVSRQIKALFNCLKTHIQGKQFFTPEVFHFKPSSLDTPISIIYPKGIAEDKLQEHRLTFHNRLLLEKNWPYFKKAAAETFLNSTALGGYLVNPHLGLAVPNSLRSGKVALVDGYYSYHHYMQDRFNDDKWGCAYRSLQTIVSWFKYQGYYDSNVPSHREIQTALFKVGDKGEKFVGSRQWIGSFEVSYVLDHLLGVSSKFINVNSGAELSTTGQQLLSHFQTQGTPIMIGGGVLAHTILGVAYDELTGNIAFLILDPHYTGGEDLKTVQDKGWCGWKEMKFWDQIAHYNMCLPQRPVAV